MIGLVISGHIHFASGMQSALNAIVGNVDHVAFVDFTESMSTDDLYTALKKAKHLVDGNDGVLFLTDIPGGSPSNRVMEILMKHPDCEAVCGINLPMLTNAVFERDGSTLTELVDLLLEIGGASLQSLRGSLENALQQYSDTNDNKNCMCEEGL